ncbi:MAG: polyphenol oxidase family protein [Caldilinea sp.]|nr:polyphenol oxidase family protein [Caldilinea sp.]MDW8440766.1 polyphenol oxidase family protein [Caldilineaceae bacterium]
MIRIHHGNGVITYAFEQLAETPVNAHVSTRHGGVSPEPWRSLNFSVARGDAPERVQENRRRLAAALGICAGDMVHCRQVHGVSVARVGWDNAGTVVDGCDGLITDAIGLPLSLVFADCVPLLLYDPDRHALGVIHAGWRGVLAGAAPALLGAMQAAYGTNPSRVLVCIGPSIGPESYEVGPEVAALAQARLPNPDAALAYPNGAHRNPHLNLWEATLQLLVEAGVDPHRVEIGGIDTARNTQDFFSHRAEQGRCGLFCMVAWLSPTL